MGAGRWTNSLAAFHLMASPRIMMAPAIAKGTLAKNKTTVIARPAAWTRSASPHHPISGISRPRAQMSNRTTPRRAVIVTWTADIVGRSICMRRPEAVREGGGAYLRLRHNAVYGSVEVLAKFEGPAPQKLMLKLLGGVTLRRP